MYVAQIRLKVVTILQKSVFANLTDYSISMIGGCDKDWETTINWAAHM
jgi:hypothetical protein